eukprot:scaffold9990_cov36-Phaeocystis_antarctica.AAC.3
MTGGSVLIAAPCSRSRIDTRSHAFLSSSRQQPPTLKLTWSRCTSHSGASKRRGELIHAPRHCALAVSAGSSSSGG